MIGVIYLLAAILFLLAIIITVGTVMAFYKSNLFTDLSLAFHRFVPVLVGIAGGLVVAGILMWLSTHTISILVR